MPELRPFRALRYTARAGRLADLVAPPYDVIDDAQYVDLCSRSPHNVVRLILDKGYSPDVLPPAEWYQEAARLLAAWRTEGLLALDPDPAYYLYTQTFSYQGRRLRRRLLLGALRLEPYDTGRVLPHEVTTPGPKISRLNLMRACRANLSPILAFFPDPDGRIVEAIDRLLIASPPLAAFTDDAGIEHELHRVADPSHQATLAAAIQPLPLYIADGHHRYETALVYRDTERAKLPPEAPRDLPLDFMLAACMSGADPGLVIRPTHRVVTWRESFRAADLLQEAEAWFTIQRLGTIGLDEALRVLEERRSQRPFIVYAGPQAGYSLLQLRNEDALRDAPFPTGSPLRHLPAAILTHGLIARSQVLRGANVSYTPDPEVAVRQAEQRERTVACLLPGVTPAEVMAVVNAGERMPAKSTYFWPKPLTGMVLRSLEAW